MKKQSTMDLAEHWAAYAFPAGLLKISYNHRAITGIERTSLSGGSPSSLSDEAARQLREYFEGKRKNFDLPLETHGTAFQEKVWAALRTIPYGETRSYKELAQLLGNERACRAVGGANNKNPIAIITPCHRVIGEDGSLTGYAGGLDMKRLLLELEQKYS